MNSRNKIVIVIAFVCLVLVSLLSIFGRSYLTQQINRGWVEIVSDRYFHSWKRDNQGQVWFKFHDTNRIETIDGKQIEIPIESENEISGFAFDQDGRLWVSTEEQLILILDAQQEWQIFSPKSSIPFRLEVIS